MEKASGKGGAVLKDQSNLCIFVLSCAEWPAAAGREGGTRHIIRRLLRFGFDSLESGSFNQNVKKQSNVNAPKVCKQHSFTVLYSHRCTLWKAAQ